MIVETFDKSSPSLIDAADNTCFINLAPAQAVAHLPKGAEQGLGLMWRPHQVWIV